MEPTERPALALLAGSDEGAAALARLAVAEDWKFTTAATPARALRALRGDGAPDVVLVAPGGGCLTPWTELCRTVKFDRRSSHTVVLFLLPPDQGDRCGDVLNAGADDCTSAAAPPHEFIARVAKALRARDVGAFADDADTVIAALANAIEGKDHYTCGHVERVGAYAVQIGRAAGVDFRGLAALKVGGVVHDIGKIGIPDQILNKPGRLTDEEMAVMRRHPVIGYDILKSLRSFADVLPIVRWHHERPNGTGYPDGLRGDQVPLLARITAVADVFDALTTDRPYRKALPTDRCRAILSESAAAGDLDDRLVATLLRIIDDGADAMAAGIVTAPAA